MDYVKYITSNHKLYDRYYDDWKMCINSYFGGVEFKNANYLRAYASDFNTPGETMNTYVMNDDGSVVSKVKARVELGVSSDYTNKGQDLISGSFYGEKLDNTPLYNYVKLIVSEYNSILFRNPPQRNIPESAEAAEFIKDVDGEMNNINEFMSLADIYTTVFGVCHIACYKPIGSDIPKWRIHTPLDVTNWEYYYAADGTLKLKSIVIKVDECDEYRIYRHITPETVETVFIGEDDDYYPDVGDEAEIMELGDGVFVITQPNELGYVPVVTIYQNTKVYNNIGSTVIQDVAQIQRSIYGDMAEVYSAITYGSHPVTIIDENTDQLNDGQIGAEPGSVVRVQSSMTGEPSYVYEFKAPPLNAITEIRELVDNKVHKLVQIAMLRTEDLIKHSNSGEQIQQYDDKLAGLIRRKAINLENAESKLWKIWADWLNTELPSDFFISYSRQYNKKAIEQEVAELQKILDVYERLGEINEDVRDTIRMRLMQLLDSTSTENGL